MFRYLSKQIGYRKRLELGKQQQQQQKKKKKKKKTYMPFTLCNYKSDQQKQKSESENTSLRTYFPLRIQQDKTSRLFPKLKEPKKIEAAWKTYEATLSHRYKSCLKNPGPEHP